MDAEEEVEVRQYLEVPGGPGGNPVAGRLLAEMLEDPMTTSRLSVVDVRNLAAAALRRKTTLDDDKPVVPWRRKFSAPLQTVLEKECVVDDRGLLRVSPTHVLTMGWGKKVVRELLRAQSEVLE